MLGSRWLWVLTVVFVLALGARHAQAQVFKPRTGKAAVVATKAPVTAAANTANPTAKKAGPTAAPAKKGRAAEATPRKGKKKGKPSGDSDTVVIDDEDDEDVKITDD